MRLQVQLLRADATTLPFRNQVFGAVLCDLPFGHAHGSLAENLELYPLVLRESARVLRPGGAAVILTSAANQALMWHLVGPRGRLETCFSLTARRALKIGFKMQAHIYVLTRSHGEPTLSDSSADCHAHYSLVEATKGKAYPFEAPTSLGDPELELGLDRLAWEDKDCGWDLQRVCYEVV